MSNKKSLTINSIFNVFYKIVSVLYPLIAVTYASHVLEAEKIGTISYAQNIVTWFVMFASLGIPLYGMREIAKATTDKEKRNKVFYELFIINCVSNTMFIVAYVLLVSFVPKFYNQLPLYLICGFEIVLNYLNVDWFYQGIEEYKYISIRSTIIKILSLISLFIFVRSKNDYVVYSLIHCLALGGNYLFNIFHLRKFVNKPTQKLSFTNHIKPILFLFLSTAAVEAYTMIDTLIIGFYLDDAFVGYYTNAIKLARLVVTICLSVGAVLTPRLSSIFSNKNYEEANRLITLAIKICLMFAIPAAAGLFIMAEPVVLLFFGESFIGAIHPLKILSTMVPFIVLNGILGLQVLVASGKEKFYVISVSCGAVLNLVLNFAFIPLYGINAAAFTSLASEIVVFVMYIIFTRRIINVSITVRYVLSTLIPIAAFVVVYVFLLSKIDVPLLAFVIICVFLCVLIYFAIGLIMKNEAMITCLQKAKILIKKVTKKSDAQASQNDDTQGSF